MPIKKYETESEYFARLKRKAAKLKKGESQHARCKKKQPVKR